MPKLDVCEDVERILIMKIFDCFIFFNELELLELRFMELYDFVDYFVLVEANSSHTGKPKPFVFEKNKERFQQYLDKVIYVKVDDCPKFTLDPVYLIENFHRNAIMRGLAGVAVEGDKIMVSDIDEIPRTEIVNLFLGKTGWYYFQPDMFYYYVNCAVSAPWGGTAIAEYGAFNEPQQLRRFSKRNSSYVGPGTNQLITHSGWHYSYLSGGDPDKIIEKAENIYESNGVLPKLGTRDEIITKMENQKDLFGRPRWRNRLRIVDISETKPKSMDAFLKKYPQFFYQEKKEII